MKLYSLPIFKSAIPLDTRRLCHFVTPESIQSCLEDVCEAWVTYLQDFVNQTNEIFGKPELPWKETERAMVSSLAAAIIRKFPKSLVVEEGRVPRIKNWGRCDLWSSIPDCSHAGGRFNFYLEVKKSKPVKSARELLDFLKGPGGVSRLYRVYTKSQSLATSKLSPFSTLSNREHQHYVIGMLATPLKANKKASELIENALHDVFENRQTIVLRKRGDGITPTRKRNLGRLPTVAVVVLPDDGHDLGMIASFTVFGSTKELLAE